MQEGMEEKSVQELHNSLLEFIGCAGINRQSMNLGIIMRCCSMPLICVCVCELISSFAGEKLDGKQELTLVWKDVWEIAKHMISLKKYKDRLHFKPEVHK